MEIIYIIVGIFSAVFAFSVGYSVMGVFKIKKQIENVLGYIDSNQRKLDSAENDIHRRIDMEIQNCNNYIDEVQSNLDKTEKDILSQLDRRLDKLENKITNKIPPTNDEVLMELKKVREDFLSLRENL